MINTTINKEVKQYSDQELIEEIVSGKTQLFEILIRRYNPVIYKTGRGYGFDHEDTQDLMQETFINSFQALAKFENRSLFKTWLIRIMLNNCYHKIQKTNHRKGKIIDIYENKTTGTMFLNTDQNSADSSLLNKELNSIIETKLNAIPEEYRLTFTLRELNGLSTAETAAIMNTTISNVKVRLNRAKTMLRKEIEKLYSPNDIYEFNLVYCDKVVKYVMDNIL